MAVREVAFELECFEWADERLEVAGRWKGLAGRKLNRPVLTVETEGGRRKHLVAMPGGHFGAAEESWRAAFDWPGDPGEITGAELEVGGKVVVDLPLPDRKRRRRRRHAPDHGEEPLRNEIAALRGQVERLRAELAGRERENMQLREQIDEGADAREGPVSDAGAATVEIGPPLAPQEDLTAELERLVAERDQTRAELSGEVERLHGERDRMRLEIGRLDEEKTRARTEVDDLREAFAEAAAEAEEVRDRHRSELEALQEELRAERATVARLTAELAAGPEIPPPRTPSGRHKAPWAAVPRPVGEDEGPVDEDRFASAFAGDEGAPDPPEPSAGSDEPRTEEEPARGGEAPDRDDEAARRAAAAAPPTEPLSPVGDDSLPAVAAVPDVLDPPGPLRAGSRPAAQPGVEDGSRPSRIPAWLRAGRGEEEQERSSGPVFQSIKDRVAGRFASNGHSDPEEDDAYDPVPVPRRSAAAARARAGATVAARRSPAELWAVRVLAALLVAVLLVAFLLILTSIA
jgi:hypothetical protein